MKEKYETKPPIVQMLQICNQDGEIINQDLISPNLKKEKLLKAYELMKLSRTMDEISIQYQRQGRMLTFPPSMGQEAIQVAIALNMDPIKDWLVPGYRFQAMALGLGKPLYNLICYWLGNEKGNKKVNGLNILPLNVLIGTQISHAAGVALAEKYKKTMGVVFSDIGDGGTSQGEFFAGMNWAAVHKLPVIYVIQNNKFAISTSKKWQTNSKTFAEKGLGVGIRSYQVDGNDFLACYSLIEKLKQEISQNPEPILIEAITYRIGPHTTADDPTLYRDANYHQENLQTDPLIRMKNYLLAQNFWDETKENALQEKIVADIKNNYEKAWKENEITLDEVFDYTFATLPPELVEQKQEIKDFLSWKEKRGNH